jgi:hypothetical protein
MPRDLAYELAVLTPDQHAIVTKLAGDGASQERVAAVLDAVRPTWPQPALDAHVRALRGVNPFLGARMLAAAERGDPRLGLAARVAIANARHPKSGGNQ